MRAARVVVFVAAVLAFVSAPLAARREAADPDAGYFENWISAAEPQVLLSVFDKGDDPSEMRVVFEVRSPFGHVFRAERTARRDDFIRASFPEDFSGSGVIDPRRAGTYEWTAARDGRVVASGRFRYSSADVRVF